MDTTKPDIFANNVPSEDVAQLVSAFVPSSFYLTPYINYLMAVPLPRNSQGCRIIDPEWRDQIRETVKCLFSNPVLVLKISSANYADEIRYAPNYNFYIGTNGTRGAFPDSSRYRDFEISGEPNNGPLKPTPALIVAYCLSASATKNFRLQKLESDKLTKSYSDYIHDNVLAQTWNPLLASFLFLLKLVQTVETLKSAESAFLPMVDFTWKVITEERKKRVLSNGDWQFHLHIKDIVSSIEREGTHRIFTHTAQLRKIVIEELRQLDAHFCQTLNNYCK